MTQRSSSLAVVTASNRWAATVTITVAPSFMVPAILKHTIMIHGILMIHGIRSSDDHRVATLFRLVTLAGRKLSLRHRRGTVLRQLVLLSWPRGIPPQPWSRRAVGQAGLCKGPRTRPGPSHGHGIFIKHRQKTRNLRRTRGESG